MAGREWRTEFGRRPWGINGLFAFGLFPSLVYVPFELFCTTAARCKKRPCVGDTTEAEESVTNRISRHCRDVRGLIWHERPSAFESMASRHLPRDTSPSTSSIQS